MQKLTYINLNNEQAVFCGAPYVLSKIGGLGLPELEFQSIRGAYQQGDTALSFRRPKRMLSVTLHIMAGSRAELYRLRMALLGVLSPDKAAQGDDRAVLIYENDHARYMTYAVPDGGLDAQGRTLDTQPNLRLGFRCESPYWFAAIPSSVAFEDAGEGFAMPFQFPVDFGRRDYCKNANNLGQVSVPVQITIVCKGEVPRLKNLTTGKEIALSAAVPAGNTLVLNTDPARLDARIIDADGMETGAFGKLSLLTPLADFTLRPGLNELAYEAGGVSAQSEITVAWRAAYEGV
ncbi:MAG TPA: phage tail family protein [Candidatus Limiplasma sp.]|nr:phage tail family protein [Candidatus Limiplasma sp.]HRX07700.1 phage tail family protein [Candidatus Limiplasma sp.]